MMGFVPGGMLCVITRCGVWRGDGGRRGWRAREAEGRLEEWVEGRFDEWAEGRLEGRLEGRFEGWVEGRLAAAGFEFVANPGVRSVLWASPPRLPLAPRPEPSAPGFWLVCGDACPGEGLARPEPKGSEGSWVLMAAIDDPAEERARVVLRVDAEVNVDDGKLGGNAGGFWA